MGSAKTRRRKRTRIVKGSDLYPVGKEEFGFVLRTLIGSDSTLRKKPVAAAPSGRGAWEPPCGSPDFELFKSCMLKAT